MARLRVGSKTLNARSVLGSLYLNLDINLYPKKKKEIIDKLLLEKISLAGIVRATGVSPRWLQYYVNKKLALVPRVVKVTSKKKGKLRLQCDEMWSFVGSKGNKQWIWLAIDALAKEIVGVYIGSRDELGAKGLWNSLLPVYRQCARSLHRFLASLLDHFSDQKTQSRSKK